MLSSSLHSAHCQAASSVSAGARSAREGRCWGPGCGDNPIRHSEAKEIIWRLPVFPVVLSETPLSHLCRSSKVGSLIAPAIPCGAGAGRKVSSPGASVLFQPSSHRPPRPFRSKTLRHMVSGAHELCRKGSPYQAGADSRAEGWHGGSVVLSGEVHALARPVICVFQPLLPQGQHRGSPPAPPHQRVHGKLQDVLQGPLAL